MNRASENCHRARVVYRPGCHSWHHACASRYVRKASGILDRSGSTVNARAGAEIASPCGGGAGTGSAADFIPPGATLPKLRDAAARCRGCDLWTCGRVVFGEGPRGATVMFVGEQPGDQEEQAGHPFVGPAGKLLDAALEEAGIDRKTVYVTNAVKHFKYERGAKGARRIHKKAERHRDPRVPSVARGRDQAQRSRASSSSSAPPPRSRCSASNSASRSSAASR